MSNFNARINEGTQILCAIKRLMGNYENMKFVIQEFYFSVSDFEIERHLDLSFVGMTSMIYNLLQSPFPLQCNLVLYVLTWMNKVVP